MNCFYAPSLTRVSDIVSVDASESRHAATSRRQRQGQCVMLVDGKGRRAQATIVSLGRHGMELRIDSIEEIAGSVPEVVLATAVAKGDRQAVLLDMATQLGIASYVPLICEHSVVKPDARNQARWLRICIQACKQSHNPWLPEIGPVKSPRQLAAEMKDTGTPLYLAMPGGDPLPAERTADRIAICIGPEGGFSPGEVAELTSFGAVPISLGRNILRIEAAAIAAVSAIVLARTLRRDRPATDRNSSG